MTEAGTGTDPSPQARLTGRPPRPIPEPLPRNVHAPAKVIEGRLMGQYNLGTAPGKKEYRDDTMLFHRGGQVNSQILQRPK